MPVWVREKLFQKKLLQRELQRASPPTSTGRRLLFTEHHLSHAAAPLSVALRGSRRADDGWRRRVGDDIGGDGRGKALETIKEIRFPHSLGLLYSAFTYYTGFKVNSGEYKLMGLAPYGEARIPRPILDKLIDLKEDGSFRLDLIYFDYCTGLTMTNDKFDELFGGPPRKPEEPLTQRHMDLAASIQA